jgi:predicted acetyltransferase
VSLGPPRHDGDWEEFTRLEGRSFGTTRDATELYVAAVRDAAIARFAVENDRVVAGALAFPCRQLVGGRPVPAGAVASVCVAPEWRGRGLGRAVTWALVAAMADAGLALAPLWPSSVAFYRAMGWEIAGEVREHRVPAAMLRGQAANGAAKRDPEVVEVAALRDAIAPGWCGPIERPQWWWDWRWPRSAPDLTHRYGWREGGELTGAVAFAQERPAGRGWGYDVRVSDLWARTSDALAGLSGLLASEGPLSPSIAFRHGALPPDHDLVWRVPELAVETTGTNAWMLRVLDPAVAVSAAGWPEWADRPLEFEIGGVGQAPARLVVEFSGGAAHAAQGGAGRVRIAAGAFAAWYSGAMRASTAALLGSASADPDDLRLMDLLTADRRPWLPDAF